MLRNIIGQISTQLNKLCFSFFLSFIFLKNRISPAERGILLKRKRKKRRYWTDFQLEKGRLLDRFSTLLHIYIYTCIHTYIHTCCEVIFWTKFGHFECYYLGQVSVIIWPSLFLDYVQWFQVIFANKSKGTRK